MIKTKAKIKLYDGSRKTPFINGYRPLFNFITEMKTSGQITLIDRQVFYPNQEGIVEITFLKNSFLGKGFNIGSKFTFGEGREPLGEGVIIEIL